jgi:hypothetical protein
MHCLTAASMDNGRNDGYPHIAFAAGLSEHTSLDDKGGNMILKKYVRGSPSMMSLDSICCLQMGIWAHCD